MFLLRWKLEYSDHKPAKAGMWSLPAQRIEDMAAFCSKENLAKAIIEGKDYQTKEIKVLAEVDGWDFVNFEWINSAFISGGVSVYQRIDGIQVVTRDKKVIVLNDGAVKITPRPLEQQNLNYEGFGK